MKLYNKIGLFAAGTFLLASCAVNDPIADKMEIGQVLPTVSWELSSSVCKAGAEAGFLVKYYTTSDIASIDHIEVWGMETRVESAAATQKLVTSPAYTLTVSVTDTVRANHILQSYAHSESNRVGQEYQMSAAFPTSSTLAPVAWSSPTEWDEEKFNMYYPETFKADFCDKMVSYLTQDSTYFGSLRNVYITYDFTKEQFDEVNAKYPNLEPLPWSDSQEVGSTKGDLWYSVDTEKTIGYYYTVVENGVTIEREVATIEEALAQGITEDKIFPVYKAPHWVFSRYSDDIGAAVTSVRAEYMPLWKELVKMIPFEKWIYNSADKNYAVDFSRKYAIVPQVRVYDTNGKYGTDTESKTVDLN